MGFWSWLQSLFDEAPTTVAVSHGVTVAKPIEPADPEEETSKAESFETKLFNRHAPFGPADKDWIKQFEFMFQQNKLKLSLAPSSAIDIMSMVNDPQCPIEKLASAIQSDPALAGSVLKLVNSVMFRGNNQITDLKQAIVRLGLRQVRLLLLTVLLNTTLVKGKPFQDFSHLLWRQSLMCARLGKILAEHVQINPDLAYMTGLFHNIGRLGILSGIRNMRTSIKEPISARGILEILRTHGFDINARIIEEWKLPDEVATAVSTLHDFMLAGTGSHYAALISLIEAMLRKHGFWTEPETINLAKHPALEFLEFDPDKIPSREDLVEHANQIEDSAEL